MAKEAFVGCSFCWNTLTRQFGMQWNHHLKIFDTFRRIINDDTKDWESLDPFHVYFAPIGDNKLWFFDCSNGMAPVDYDYGVKKFRKDDIVVIDDYGKLLRDDVILEFSRENDRGYLGMFVKYALSGLAFHPHPSIARKFQVHKSVFIKL